MAERLRRVDEISQESKRRILDAAEALFAEKGYERTSFMDIAEASGISRGSIPWHFQNKEGLLVAVVERAQLRALRDAHMSPTAPFRDVMSVLAGIAGKQLPFMLVTEAMQSEGGLRGQFVDYYRRRRQGIRELIEAAEGDDLPTDDEDREKLATVILAALIGLDYQHLLDPENVNFSGAMDALCELVDRAYGWK